MGMVNTYRRRMAMLSYLVLGSDSLKHLNLRVDTVSGFLLRQNRNSL